LRETQNELAHFCFRDAAYLRFSYQIRAFLSSGFKRLSRFLRLGIVEASFTLLSLLKTLQIRNDAGRKGEVQLKCKKVKQQSRLFYLLGKR